MVFNLPTTLRTSFPFMVKPPEGRRGAAPLGNRLLAELDGTPALDQFNSIEDVDLDVEGKARAPHRAADGDALVIENAVHHAGHALGVHPGREGHRSLLEREARS